MELPHVDAQIEQLPDNAPFEAENCLITIDLTPGYTTQCGKDDFHDP